MPWHPPWVPLLRPPWCPAPGTHCHPSPTPESPDPTDLLGLVIPNAYKVVAPGVGYPGQRGVEGHGVHFLGGLLDLLHMQLLLLHRVLCSARCHKPATMTSNERDERGFNALGGVRRPVPPHALVEVISETGGEHCQRSELVGLVNVCGVAFLAKTMRAAMHTWTVLAFQGTDSGVTRLLGPAINHPAPEGRVQERCSSRLRAPPGRDACAAVECIQCRHHGSADAHVNTTEPWNV